jgi:pyruvate dehydrogenase (quinone)
VRLMQEVALHNVQVTGPEPPNCACRAALGGRGVAHLMIAKDVQMMKRSADKRPMRNQAHEPRRRGSPPLGARPAAQLKAAVDG